MRKTVLLSMIMGLMLSAQSLVAQAPTIQWQKSLGGSNQDIAYNIQLTTDGGYIVAGGTSSIDGDVTGQHGLSDFWVVKLDSQGGVLWQKTLGGSGEDIARSIQQTNDGGYIVAGYTYSTNGDITGNNGQSDYWVVKLNSQGDLLWQKTLGGSNQDDARSIQQTADGGYIVAGWTLSINGDVTGNHGERDYWVVKIDSQGTIQWQKTLGGTADDFPSSIQQTNDGGYIVAGYTSSNEGDVSGNNGLTDYWVVKLNIQGELVWQKTLGGSDSDAGISIHTTADGGYVVGGYAYSNNGDVSSNQGNTDYWVVKLDNQGVILWQKTLGGTNQDAAYSIQPTSDGGYIVAGYTLSTDGDIILNHGAIDYWVVKLNYQGTIQWQKTLGGTAVDYANNIQLTSDGGYIVAGYSNSNNGDVTGNQGNNDMWIVKLSPDALQTLEFGSNLVSISPNPTSDNIKIQLKNITELNGGTINIINSLGQVIITTPIKITEMNNSIELNTLGSKGIYFVQIINSKGQLIDVKKIILQ
ncbi:MAG: T9SS type A sorting domain-containing protein [Flavobacterium sp.]|nr:T9SS type A sorting domain-containing protein [Flavobacterium sp.]